MVGSFDPSLLAAMFGVALLAGGVDAIAGGGGLITVPALILAGLDPVSAVATNKLQGSVGACSATLAFARRRLIVWRQAWPIAVAAAVGSVFGALSVGLLPRPVLDAGVPVLLVGIALYFAFGARMREDDAGARLSPAAFALGFAPAVGFYDGVFGPGAGAFYMVGFVTLLGLGVVKATAHTKLANAASNLGSLGLFALAGHVVWPIGIVMAVGAYLGAQVGSMLAVRLGARLIRPLLVTIACAMAVRLLSDPANPLRVALAGLLGG
ncbi:putative membrane transporter protein YfcA [Methylobacterium cerastii]|uniref:Probable membrane transporter protein n=1 Tax=Methylobacterium cerastii TaxID=932741 RepID=A0ABQ4QEY5_9HYPH|nr:MULTISPECIES: TSUP family transporter [Methylobacterium]TXM67183.1 TSUP family transporter [Methylobacterium sp. WL120]TXN81434.1 TSUP family transporter [Methylobacterium sp. WL8]GJD43814.1 putative membrane transporter protein YfcA [Methylobacterium cerastii]